jgi:hypothetical protein
VSDPARTVHKLATYQLAGEDFLHLLFFYPVNWDTDRLRVFLAWQRVSWVPA